MDVYSNASSCSADISFLENFITGEEVEDESLEWLSTYVEECFCDTTSYTTPLTCTTNDSSGSSTPHQLCPKLPPSKPSSKDSQVLLPTKSRSKRRRITPKKFLLDSHQSLLHLPTLSDPLLHHQTYWLAESELLLPLRKEEDKALEQQLRMRGVGADEQCGNERSLVQQQQQQPIRRCAHCLSHKTPQWRAGPMGPKTLCNACGVSYKKGRLLPEYRPAKSPTFVSYKHSNSYKKVMEMRMAVMASSAK